MFKRGRRKAGGRGGATELEVDKIIALVSTGRDRCVFSKKSLKRQRGFFHIVSCSLRSSLIAFLSQLLVPMHHVLLSLIQRSIGSIVSVFITSFSLLSLSL